MTESHEEMIDVYDSDGRLLGQATSRSAHSQGLWHRAFHCWIGQVCEGGSMNVVLQQRGPFARDYPNFLDISVAGHYQAGEDIGGGIREFKEELGLSVSSWQMRHVASRTVNERLANGTVNREFQDIYFLLNPFDFSSCVPSWPEVAGIFRAPLLNLIELLDGLGDAVRCEGVAFDPSSGQLRPVTRITTVDSFIPSAREYLKVVLRKLRDHLACPQGPPLRAGHARSQEMAVRLADGSLWEPCAE